jgi:hypothetical protein
MTEYIITIEDESKAKSLITYLKSLDFVKIKPKTVMVKEIIRPSNRISKSLSSFLKGLPEVDYNDLDVINAINLMRHEEKAK